MRPSRARRTMALGWRLCVAVLLATNLSGCAYIALGALAFSGGGGGGGTKVKNKNQAPALSFTAIPAPAPTELFATIDYDLVDPNGDDVDLLVEFSTDGGAVFAPAVQGPGSDGVTGLAASSAGTMHVYVWNFLNDLYGNDILLLQSLSFDVTLRFSPTDVRGLAGTPDTVSFRVGNQPPAVSIQPVADEVTAATVVVQYNLIDDFSDPIDVLVEYSQNKFATAGILASELVGSTTCPEGVTGVSSAPSPGMAHCFEWDYPQNFVNAAEPVSLRFTVTDSAGATGVAFSNEFRIGNDPPITLINSIDTGFGVSVDYTLLDDTSDQCSIELEWSTDSGGTWFPTTNLFGSTSGLASSPSGFPHNVTWNPVADLGVVQTDVRIRMRATDIFLNTGAYDESVDFTLFTNAQPYAFIDSPLPLTILSGTAPIDYILADVNLDPVDIAAVVREGGIAPFVPATEDTSGGSEGTTGLSSSQVGDPHLFEWDSTVEFPSRDANGVQFRITPSDPTGTGTASTVISLKVNNNVEPTATVTSPAAPLTGNAMIDYTVADTESDSTTVIIQYTTVIPPGPGDWRSPTPGTGGDGTVDLPTSPTPTPYAFAWDTLTDIGAVSQDVLVRITPFDNPDPDLGYGLPIQTAQFTINNDPASAPPVLFSIAPSSGNVVGGNSVIIAGDNFNAVTTATIAGNPMQNLNLVSSSTLVGDVPPGAGPGAVDLVVDNGNGAATLVGGYRYTLPPTVTIDPSLDGSTTGGNVSINYTLADADSDLCSITVRISTNGGATFNIVATPAAGGDGTRNLTSSPGGTPHVYSWNSVADNIALTAAEDFVRVRITPSDTEPGTPDSSGDFTVDNSVGRFALVTNWTDGTVSYIDTVNLAVDNTFPVGANPWGITVSPDGRFAAVANYTGDSISVIDLATQMVLPEIPAGNAPTDLVFNRTGTELFVLNDLDGTVSVYDVASWTEIDTDFNGANGVTRIGDAQSPAPNMSSAQFIRLGPGGHEVWVGVSNAVNTTDYTHRFTGQPASVAHWDFASDYGLLYDAYTTSNIALRRLDIQAEIDLDNDDSTTLSGSTGISRLDVATSAYRLKVHRDRLFVVDNSAQTLSVVDTATHTEVQARIPLPAFGDSRIPAINANGALAIVPNFGPSTVSVVDIGAGAVLTDIPVGTNPAGSAFTGRGTTDPVPVGLYRAWPDFGQPGSEVILEGYDFDATLAENEVRIGGVLATVTAVDKSTTPETLTVIVPTLAVGQHAITVDVNTPGLKRSNDLRFTVYSGPLAYVTVWGPDAVAVIDVGAASGAELVGMIPVGGDPWELTVSPRGDRLYVANGATQNFSAIDLVTHREIDQDDDPLTTTTNAPPGVTRMFTGSTPRGIITDLDGQRLFVHNQGDDTLTAIDVSSIPFAYIDTDDNINTSDGFQTGITRFPGLPYGNEIVMFPTGDRVMVGNTDIVNVSSLPYVSEVDMPLYSNEEFALDESGDILFSSRFGWHTIGVWPMWFWQEIDSDNDLSTTSPGALEGITSIEPPASSGPWYSEVVGDSLYNFNWNTGIISVYDVDTLAETAAIDVAVLSAANGMDVSADATRAYLSNTGTDRFQATDLVGGVVLSEPAVGSDPYKIALGKPTTAEPIRPVQRGLSSRLLPEGASLRVEGQGFDATPGNNVVTIGGVAATVTAVDAASTPNTLDVTIPSGIAPASVKVELAVNGMAANPLRMHVSSGPFLYVTVNDGSDNRRDGLVAVDRSLPLPRAVARIPSVVDAGVSGANPIGFAIHPSGSKIYVANSVADSIGVIDLNTHTLLAEIAAGDNPQWVAFTPDGLKGYAYNVTSNSITVIDATTDTFVQNVTGFTTDSGLVMEEGGARMYVGGHQILDTTTDSLIGDLNISNLTALDRFFILPGDRYAWKTSSSNSTISVIDLRSRLEIDQDGNPATTGRGALSGVTRIPEQNDPAHFVGWGPWAMEKIGDRMFVANWNLNNISVVDIPSRTELDTDDDPLTTDPATGTPPTVTRIDIRARDGLGVPVGSTPTPYEMTADEAADLLYVCYNNLQCVGAIGHDQVNDTYTPAFQITVGPNPRDVQFGRASTSEPIPPLISGLGGAGFSIVGGELVIRGSGFGATQGQITIGGVLVDLGTYLISWTDTEIRITIPPGTLSGDVVVQSSGGLSSAPSFLQIATGPFAYVLGREADTVSVVDLGTSPPELAGGVVVGNSPREIRITPDGSRAYVTNFVDDNLSVIDLAIHEVVATLTFAPPFDGPAELAMHPTGAALFVLTKNVDDELLAIDVDPASGTYHQEIGRYSTPNLDRDLAINPQGTILIAGGQNLIDADPLSPTFMQLIGNLDQAPADTDHALFLDGGSEIWRSDDSADKIAVFHEGLRRQIDVDLDFSTQSTSAPVTGVSGIPAGDGPRQLVEHNGVVYVSNWVAGDDISVFDVATRTGIDTDGNGGNGITPFPIGAVDPVGIAIEPGSDLLIAAGFANDFITVLDISTPSSPVIVAEFMGAEEPVDVVVGKPSSSEPIPPVIRRVVAPSTGGETRLLNTGDSIRIVGNGFDPVAANNSVTFPGAAPVTPGAATATTLDVTVPGGALTGNITVTTNGVASRGHLCHIDAGPFVYINSFGNGTETVDGIVVVDPDILEVVQVIPTGLDPVHMVITPDGSRMYTANDLGDSVTAIDLATHTPIVTIPVLDVLGNHGDRCRFITTNTDGTLVFTRDRNDSTSTVIDIDPGSPTYHQVIDFIAGITGLDSLAMDGSRRYFYTGATDVVDTVTRAKVGTLFPGPATADRLVVLPGDAFGWRADNSTDEIALVDLRLRREVDIDNDSSNGLTRITAGGGPQFMTVAGSRVYVSNIGEDTVSVFDYTTNTEVDTDNNGGNGLTRIDLNGTLDPRLIAADVANDRAYVPMQGSDFLNVIDFDPVGDTYASTAQIRIGATSYSAVMGPTGGPGPLGPRIAGLSSDLARTGDTLFISGAGFGATQGASQVFVDGVLATVVSWSDTLIEITVPGGAMAGEVTVVVGGLTSNGVFLQVTGGPFLYVTCAVANEVAVIDLSVPEVVGAIPTGDSPQGIAITPDGSKAYVANASTSSSEITIIDLDTHTATNLTLGHSAASRPFRIAVHPNGQEAYITLLNASRIAVLDTATDTEIDADGDFLTTDPGAPPGVTRISSTQYWTLDINPEGTLLLAGGQGLFNVDPNAIIGDPAPLGRYTAQTSLDAGTSTTDRSMWIEGGHHIWRTDTSANAVDVFDLGIRKQIDIDADNGTPSAIAVGGAPRGIEGIPGLDKIFAANTNDATVSVIDELSRAVIATIPLNALDPRHLAVDDAGTYVAVSGLTTDVVTLIDPVTETLIPGGEIYVADEPHQLAFGKLSTIEPIPPRITGLSTNIGAVGDTITIFGVGFDPTPANNTVNFNGNTATPSSGDSTMLTVTVPASVTTGPVSVSHSGLTSNGSQYHIPTGQLAYVTNEAAPVEGILVLDLDPAVYEIIRTIPTALNPSRVAIVTAGPDAGDIYVTHFTENPGRVTIIDGATHTVATEIFFGIDLHDIEITAAGDLAYVISQGDNTLYQIDVSTRTVTANSLGGLSNDLELSLDPNDPPQHALVGGLHVVDISNPNSLVLAGDNNVLQPERGIIDDNGLLAYCSSRLQGNVGVVDLDPLSVNYLMEIDNIDLTQAGGGTIWPTRMAMDAATDTLLVLQTNGEYVSFADIDPLSGTAYTELDTDADINTTDTGAKTGMSRAISSAVGRNVVLIESDASGLFYITDDTGDVLSIMDTTITPMVSKSYIATITVSTSPNGLAITP